MIQFKCVLAYEALRSFYVNESTAEEVAENFGYKVSTVYALTRDFKNLLRSRKEPVYRFFQRPKSGRKRSSESSEIEELIVDLRKQYLSVSQIKGVLDSLNKEVSERHIYHIIKKEGFARLPRRSLAARIEASNNVQIEAPKSKLLEYAREDFTSEGSIGILCLIPLMKKLGIDRLIEGSNDPGTKTIPKLNSILSFTALKLSNVNRYTADDLWCMDRGLGLFAGLNVLPKAAWYTSYSHRVKRETNLEFLKSLSKLWQDEGLLSDTANLDFTTIPYWGEDDSHLENNWSGTITNDFLLPVEQVVRKYAKRWIVEKTISEQIEFFHLNRLSSAMVIKVDFDLTMSILAHNLYRIFAAELEGYEHCTAYTIFRKFIRNSGNISIQDNSINVDLNKKRHLPVILTAMDRMQGEKIDWLGGKKLNFRGASYS